MFDISSAQEKIIKADNFEQALIIFDEYLFSTEVKKSELLKLLEYLQCKVENPTDVYIVKDFYYRLNELEPLSKFLEACPFQDSDKVKNMRISVEKSLGNYDLAEQLCNSLQEDNDYNKTQRASILNKLGETEEARKLIEQVLVKNVDKYNIKVYASIINRQMKYDDYANDLCIPSLARDICKEEDVNPSWIIRFLTKILKYENDLGNKRECEITKNIIINYAQKIKLLNKGETNGRITNL